MKRLLGLDISLNCTGWSIIDVDDDKNMSIVDYGYIPNNSEESTEERLGYVYRRVKSVVEQYNPDIWVGESQFFGSNVKTLMQLSHTHGVLLLLASTYGKRIYYYSPQTIKSVVLGGIKLKDENGKKKTSKQLKKEVEIKVKEYFGSLAFFKETTDDVFDAVAVAMCYVSKDGKGYVGEMQPNTKKNAKKSATKKTSKNKKDK